MTGAAARVVVFMRIFSPQLNIIVNHQLTAWF